MNLQRSSQQFPKKLYIQLDNTARENKNRCVLSFLACLVQIQVFDEVGIVSDAIHLYINILYHRLNLASLWWAIHMKISMLYLGTFENG